MYIIIDITAYAGIHLFKDCNEHLIYIYIYIYICVCVCVLKLTISPLPLTDTQTYGEIPTEVVWSLMSGTEREFDPDWFCHSYNPVSD